MFYFTLNCKEWREDCLLLFRQFLDLCHLVLMAGDQGRPRSSKQTLLQQTFSQLPGPAEPKVTSICLFVLDPLYALLKKTIAGASGRSVLGSLEKAGPGGRGGGAGL